MTMVGRSNPAMATLVNICEFATVALWCMWIMSSAPPCPTWLQLVATLLTGARSTLDWEKTIYLDTTYLGPKNWLLDFIATPLMFKYWFWFKYGLLANIQEYDWGADTIPFLDSQMILRSICCSAQQHVCIINTCYMISLSRSMDGICHGRLLSQQTYLGINANRISYTQQTVRLSIKIENLCAQLTVTYPKGVSHPDMAFFMFAGEEPDQRLEWIPRHDGHPVGDRSVTGDNTRF